MCDVLRTFTKFFVKCSTVPFAHGACGVTLVCLNPMCFAKLAKSWLLNGGPLSAPSLQGMPKFVMILSIARIMADVRAITKLKKSVTWTIDKFRLNNSLVINGTILRFAYQEIDVQRRKFTNF